MANSGPGYREHPEHRVTVRPRREHAKVVFRGEVIAETNEAIMLEESGMPVVPYVPRADVKMDRLTKTDHHTRCPFKGEASYFSVAGAPDGENAVWSYEHPYDEVPEIAGYLAFYPNKFDVTVG